MNKKVDLNKAAKTFYGKGEKPGEYPFKSGIYPSMYQKRLWTMRQYAGFTSAEESNKRFHYLLDNGVMGLSVAFDLPTQTGYDSDHPMSIGEVGRVGVPISTLEDMETLIHNIPLDKVSISMTINSTAAILLSFLIVAAEKQGIKRSKLTGTIQNDILKEYIARGTYIYPPTPSMKIITDLFEFCSEELPNWNTISISGYHIREAGSTAVQEIAFTLANGIAYVESAIKKGLDINKFGKRISFFFNCHNNFFEEVAKFRAARSLWANIMKERFNATDPKAMMCRFHTQTAGSTLQAQQIDNNIVRTTLQATAAVLGGTQSLHTNSKDEALSLPTKESAELALRTQQIIAHESAITDVTDPLAGSYYVEDLTEKMRLEALELINKIDELGGAISALDQEFQQNEIAKSAFDYQKSIDNEEKIINEVNKFKKEEKTRLQTLKIDQNSVSNQLIKLEKFKKQRNKKQVASALKNLEKAANTESNLIPEIIKAIKNDITLGEISDTFRKIFGEH